MAEQNRLYVNVTVTTLDAKLARILEPRAPRPDLRMNAVEELNRAGIDAGVICAPVLPGITDSEESLEALVAATKKAGGKNIFANPLFLKPCSAAVFLPFLEKEFPALRRSNIRNATPAALSSQRATIAIFRSAWQSCGRNTRSTSSESRARTGKRTAHLPRSCRCFRQQPHPPASPER